MEAENSWSVELDARGNVVWVAGDEILTDQPARNFSQRVQDVFFRLFPKDLYRRFTRAGATMQRMASALAAWTSVPTGGRGELDFLAMPSRVLRSFPVLALLLVSACVSVPSSEQFRATRAVFPEEHPGLPVADGRASFRQLFCSVLQRDGLAASNDPQCEASLWKLSDEPSLGESPDRSATPAGELRCFVVSGALGDCFGPDGQPFRSGIARLRERGEPIELITVSGRSGAAHNARQIAEALWSAGIQPGDRLGFVGYSKGTIDILQFLVDCPELASGVVAVVGLSSPVFGSPLAAKAEWSYRHLLAGSFFLLQS